MEDSVEVIVVGAGFAGLAAASALKKSGRSARVLEARDRVGGRVHTVTVEGGPWVDVGGQWAGPTQDHLLGLFDELGVTTFPTWTKGDNLVIVEGRSTRYRGTIPRLSVLSLLDVGWAQWRLDRMAKQVPLDAPWRAPRAKEWDARTLADWLDDNLRTKVARHLFEAGLETVYATGARDLSLLHALFYIHSGKNLDMLLGSEGGAQAARVDGGMQSVAERLAAPLDVRLSSPVRRIEHGGDGVVVHHDGGTTRGSRVIVAVPPKLVTQIQFDPPLSGARAELAERMPMGAVIKCTAIYDRPFWRDRGLSGMCLSDEGPVHVAFDNSPPAGEVGVLMGFVEAEAARRLGKLTIEERERAAVRCFARHVGEQAMKPRHYVDHVWEHDPWSGGCYGAFMPPGVWTTLGSSIRQPQGRIHWAGTETATVWSGYIDGAISSGKRAAEEVRDALDRPGH